MGPSVTAALPTLPSPFNPDTAVTVTSPQPGIQYTLVGTAGGTDPVIGDIYRGLDLFSRVKDLEWYSTGSSTDLVRIQHGYDRIGNRLWRRDLVAEASGAGLDELYQYDLINRLKELDRGTLNSPGTGVTAKKFAQCWSLDTTGNWSGFREDDNGDGIWDLVQSRSANPVNEITGITNAVGSTWVQPKYDAAGNMTTVPQPADPTKAYTCKYDAWNRLVNVVDVPSGNTVAQYAYDGAKRRTIKKTFTAGVLSETRHFFYTDPQRWQVVEERVGTSTNAERQFVWGLRYIDDLLLRDRDTTGGGTLNERLYGLQDPNWNMVTIVNASGTVQERYAYDAYGTATFLTGMFALRVASQFAWETLYAGYRRDSETSLLQVRNRVLQSKLGWIQRDPLGLGGSTNLYQYVASDPIRFTDPSGLFSPGTTFPPGIDLGQLIGSLTLPAGLSGAALMAFLAKYGLGILLGALGVAIAWAIMGFMRCQPAFKNCRTNAGDAGANIFMAKPFAFCPGGFIDGGEQACVVAISRYLMAQCWAPFLWCIAGGGFFNFQMPSFKNVPRGICKASCIPLPLACVNTNVTTPAV